MGFGALGAGPDDSIDFDLVGASLTLSARPGWPGSTTCGTAGEFHTLEEDEFDALSELVAEAAPAPAPPSKSALATCAGRPASLASAGRSLAPAAIQVVLPDWLPLSQVEVRVALERMAAAADPVPLVFTTRRMQKRSAAPSSWRRWPRLCPASWGSRSRATTLSTRGCTLPRQSY